MHQHDVLSICNALVDILIEVKEEDLTRFKLSKGVMHLVESAQQFELIKHFGVKPLQVELGGSAMNATRVMAALGAKTYFVGMIGKDEFGRKIHSRMAELGISSGVKETDQPTGSCAVLITPDHERTMVTCLGASSLYNEQIVPHEHISKSKILHFTGYQWSTPQQKEAIYQAVATAEKSNTLVSFDVADPFMVQNCRAEFCDFIAEHADLVFANEAEARGLYNSSPEECARSINKNGATAIIKLGAKGAIVSKDGKIETIAPVSTKVLDTTGAGDMFAGGFLYGYSKGRSLQDCGRIAALLASDVISRIGANVSEQAITKAKNL